LPNTIAGKPRAYWEALAFFLSKERARHLKDIKAIDLDLFALKEHGIEIPDVDPEIFIKVPEKQS